MDIHRRMAAVALFGVAALVYAAAAAAAPTAPAGVAAPVHFGLVRPIARPNPITAPNETPTGPSAGAPARSQSDRAHFRTVDVPGAYGTLVTGVNDEGELVGSYYTDNGAESFGFSERGRKPTTVNYPGTSGVTQANAISDHGIVVGAYTDAAGTYHGWIRSADGVFTQLDDPLAGSGSGLGTLPYGINDAGVIVGGYVDKDNLEHGFIYSPASGFTTVDAPGALPPGMGTVLVSINDSGVITGLYVDSSGVYHGFVYSQGSFLGFDAPGAGTGSGQGTIPYGITRNGTVSGWMLNDNNVASGWLLSNWQFSTLNDPLAATGPGLGSTLYGIDQHGNEAGGEYWDASGHFHGFVVRLPKMGGEAA